MKIVATICSRKKKEDPELLPAHERYLGLHVAAVNAIAKEQFTDFYILSGKYGLISGDEKIPNYDYLLEEKAVDDLVEIVVRQIAEAGITEIAFYTEDNPNWKPYEKTITQAAARADIDCFVHQL